MNITTSLARYAKRLIFLAETVTGLKISNWDSAHEHISDAQAHQGFSGDYNDLSNLPTAQAISRSILIINAVGGELEIETPAPFTDINNIDIWVNGFKLIRNSEFISSPSNPGTHIALSSELIASDNLEIIVW